MIFDEAPEHHVEEENYFVSMTDMMVGLIFIFIIMLTFYALQFREETQRLDGSGTREGVLNALNVRLETVGVDIEIDPETGVARLPERILFDSARAELKADGRRDVEELARALAAILPCHVDNLPRPADCPEARHRIESVYIEGHTDADAMAGGGALRDNWDLSVARATNTYRELVRAQPVLETLCVRRRAGEGACQPVLSVSGYGAQRPVAVGDGIAQKQKNRRIDIRFIMTSPDAAPQAERP